MADKDLVMNIILKASDKASKEFEKIRRASGGLSGELFKQQQALKNVEQAQKKLGRVQEVRRSLAGLAESLDKVRARQKELLAEIKSGGKATTKQTAEMNQLARQAEVLTNKQSKARKELGELNKELGKAGVSAGHFRQKEKELAAAHEKTTAAVKRQTAALDKLNAAQARVQKAAEIRDHAAKVSLVAGGAAFAVGRGLSVPVKAYAESETAGMDLRVAMMDKTGKVAAEYEQIDALATRLGDKLPGTTADFKNLMTMLIRQGMSAQTILGGTGEAAALLAVQLKKSPEAAAEMAAKLQDATRGTEKEMLGIIDQAQRLFYAGVDDGNILGAFSKMAPALDVLKIKGEAAMKQMAPLIGMLDQAGLSGESAGNALRKVFDRAMSQDVQKAVAKAKKSGMVDAGFSLDFTNGKGEFGGMEKMYRELAKLKGLTTQARGELLKSIFGDDAETMQALNTMIEKGQAGYEEFAAKMEKQASLKQRVDAQLGTLSNLWDAASGTGMNFLASMGESVSGELKMLVEWIGSVNEKLSTWAKNNPETANTLMKIAAVVGVVLAGMAGLSAVLAAVILPLASFRYLLTALKVGQFAAQLGGLSKAFGLLKTGVQLFFGVLKANPMIFAISLIVIALYMLWDNWDAVKNALITGWEWIKNVFRENPILAFVTGPIGAMIGLIANWDKVKAAIVAGWQYLKNILRDNPILGFLLGPIGVIGTLIANFDRLKKKAIEVKNAIANSGIGRAVGGAYNTVKGWVGFSRGGYTGPGGVNQAAGIVHKGEVVFSQSDVAKFGGWRAVEAIRRGGVSMLARAGERLRGFTGGSGMPALAGVVPVPKRGFSAAAGGASVNIGGDTVTINVHAAAGMSEQGIVDKIMSKLAEREAVKARRYNSRFSDKD